MSSSLYDNADIYEFAFSDRNFDAEAHFILSAFNFHSRNDTRPAILDIAAGTGQHAAALVKAGCRVTLLDRSAAMLDRARQRLDAFAGDVEFYRADMRQFTLPATFDRAICMLDSLSHVIDPEDMISHFRSVAGALKEGGLYLVELSAPDIDGEPSKTEDTWTVQCQDGRVTVRWGVNRSWVDRSQRILRIPVEISHETGSGNRSISETMIMREWTSGEIDRCLQSVPELRRLQTYGSFDVNKAFDAAAWRMIILMEKQAPPG